MKIIYIANARFPTEKAHGIQIMKMCEAFAVGNELELVLPRRLNKIKEDAFLYYGLAPTFMITKLPCLDLIPLHKYLGHLGLWIESVTFLFSIFVYMFFKRADIIYTRDKYVLPLGFFRKDLILETHAFPQNYFLYSLFLKRLNGIVVITQKLKERFTEKGMAESKILVASDGVDIGKFQIQNSESQIREKLGLPQNKKIVLYAGHLYEWKGVFVLAEASQYLSDDAEVYFVGGTTEDVRKFKIQNSKFKTVRVIGHRPHAEIPYWLRAADVLVLPNSGREEISKYWTSPLKMFEYMAARKPIVASDLPSIREILNEENAILVKPDNVQALALGIEKALRDPGLSDAISAEALKDVKNYTWQKRVQKIYEYLRTTEK